MKKPVLKTLMDAIKSKKEELEKSAPPKSKKKRKLEKRKNWLDWFDRDSDTFTRAGSKFRSGWEKAHSSMSDFVLGGRIPIDERLQFEEIKDLCKNRVSTLTPIGKRIRLGFHPNTSFTDGKMVYVSSEVFDHAPYSFSQKSDTMLGLTTHEMAHVLYTDFSLAVGLTPFQKAIENVIEDERIERIIGEEFPGYVINLSAAKEYYFNEKYLYEDDEEGGEEKTEIYEIWDCFFKAIRYPAYLSEDLEKKHHASLEEIKNVLTPYPETFSQVIDCSKKIEEILKKYMTEESIKKMFPEKAKGGEGEGEGEGEGTFNLKDVWNSLTAKQKEEVKNAVESIMKAIADKMKSLESESDETKAESKSSGDSGDEESKGTSSDIKMAGIVLREGGKIDMEDRFSEVYDKDNETFFSRVDPSEIDVNKYQEFKRLTRSDSARLANTLAIKTFSENKILHGYRSGNLDDNRIVEAVHGVKTVYTSKIEKETKKVSMVLLIDESGSMHGHKADNAMKVAIILEQCFKMFPQGQLFIYGFTSDHEGYTNYVKRYKEPGIDVKFGLGAVTGICQNRDGDCIKAVADRVRKFTQEKMLYFIISDGQPSSSDYYGMSAIEHTRKAVLDVTAKGFFPVQIGIETDERYQKMMFTDYVNFSDSRQMVENIRKLFLKKARHLINV